LFVKLIKGIFFAFWLVFTGIVKQRLGRCLGFQGGFVRYHYWLQQQPVFTEHLNRAQLADMVLQAKQSTLLLRCVVRLMPWLITVYLMGLSLMYFNQRHDAGFISWLTVVMLMMVATLCSYYLDQKVVRSRLLELLHRRV
jgi:hypothetical protein